MFAKMFNFSFIKNSQRRIWFKNVYIMSDLLWLEMRSVGVVNTFLISELSIFVHSCHDEQEEQKVFCSSHTVENNFCE